MHYSDPAELLSVKNYFPRIKRIKRNITLCSDFAILGYKLYSPNFCRFYPTSAMYMAIKNGFLALLSTFLSQSAKMLHTEVENFRNMFLFHFYLNDQKIKF